MKMYLYLSSNQLLTSFQEVLLDLRMQHAVDSVVAAFGVVVSSFSDSAPLRVTAASFQG